MTFLIILLLFFFLMKGLTSEKDICFSYIGSFLSKLEIVLNTIATSGKTCIIMGDFNINLLINSNRNTKTYTDLFTSYGYYPFINKPTRVSTHSATVIDHIWCNNTDMVTGGGILLCDISDHFATFLLLDKRTN